MQSRSIFSPDRYYIGEYCTCGRLSGNPRFVRNVSSITYNDEREMVHKVIRWMVENNFDISFAPLNTSPNFTPMAVRHFLSYVVWSDNMVYNFNRSWLFNSGILSNPFYNFGSDFDWSRLGGRAYNAPFPRRGIVLTTQLNPYFIPRYNYVIYYLDKSFVVIFNSIEEWNRYFLTHYYRIRDIPGYEAWVYMNYSCAFYLAGNGFNRIPNLFQSVFTSYHNYDRRPKVLIRANLDSPIVSITRSNLLMSYFYSNRTINTSHSNYDLVLFNTGTGYISAINYHLFGSSGTSAFNQFLPLEDHREYELRNNFYFPTNPIVNVGFNFYFSINSKPFLSRNMVYYNLSHRLHSLLLTTRNVRVSHRGFNVYADIHGVISNFFYVYENSPRYGFDLNRRLVRQN